MQIKTFEFNWTDHWKTIVSQTITTLVNGPIWWIVKDQLAIRSKVTLEKAAATPYKAYKETKTSGYSSTSTNKPLFYSTIY